MTDPLTPQSFRTSHHNSQPAPSRSSASIERAGPGTTVGGRYALRAAVGHGGMGTVWRATDTQLGRAVAVKEVVTPPGIAPEDRDAMYERMLREARAAALISHPGVVQVYDVVTDGGRPWIVMELLDARSLSDMVLEDGPLAARAVAKIGVTLLGALEVAHAAGVLHRDVKPANVLVCADGRCVLTDFGVARMPTDQQLTTPGMVLGSPHFISPERAMGASFGPPSDLFSLGVTLYCAVEGQPPFDRGEPIATMHSVVEDEPRPPQRAGVLTDMLYGLLEKNPDRRWDASTARSALRRLLAGPLASGTPQYPTDPYAVVPAQRQPWQSAAAPAPAPAAAGKTGQIGGRALLAPGEAPTDRAGAPAPASRPAPADETSTGAYPPVPDDATAGMPAVSGPAPAAGGWAGPPGPRDWAASAGWGDARPRTRRGARTRSGLPDRLRQAGTVTRQVAGQAAGCATQTFQRAPRRATVVAAAGLATLVLVTSVWLLVSGGDPDPPPPQAQGGPAADPADATGPLIEVREFSDRGITVNLPAGWTEAERTDIRVDFVEPGDPVSRIRLLTEPSGMEARAFIENIAEGTIADNCAEGYERLALTDIEVDGQPAALLEYGCGSGEGAQRTRWVTTVRDGTAYSFFLRVTADRYESTQPIFDELLRSYRIGA